MTSGPFITNDPTRQAGVLQDFVHPVEQAGRLFLPLGSSATGESPVLWGLARYRRTGVPPVPAPFYKAKKIFLRQMQQTRSRQP